MFEEGFNSKVKLVVCKTFGKIIEFKEVPAGAP